jgi:hypothetical protein
MNVCIYIICIQSFMFKPKLLCIFYLYLSMCCRHLAAVYPRYAGDFLTSLELRWKLSSGGELFDFPIDFPSKCWGWCIVPNQQPDLLLYHVV